MLTELLAKFSMPSISHKKRWVTAVAIGAALLLPQTGKATIQSTPSAQSPIQLSQSRPPRRSRPPAGLVSGATRGECPVTNSAIAADDNYIAHLFPTESEYSYASYTSDSTPRLWAYLPYAIDENSPVEFVLKSAETREVVYSSGAIALEANAGIIGFDLPIALEPAVGYHWLVRIYCNDAAAHNPSQFIKGGIMYTEDNYDISERWYDHLNEVTAAYQANPNDATAQATWAQMLTDTGLNTMPETSVQNVITLQP